MSHFDYSTTNHHEVLNWTIDAHGFVQVETINLEI
jgi:hypothetical protein